MTDAASQQWVLMTPHHSGLLLELESVCFGEQGVLNTSMVDTLLSSLTVFGYFLQDSTGNVIGAILFQIVGEEGELLTLMVHPRERGHGFGEKILRYGMKELFSRQVLELFLEVRPSNAAAQKLYAKLGGEVVGQRRRYYADGEDADVYKFNLPL